MKPMSEDQESVTITPADFEPVAVQWSALYSDATGEVVDLWMSEGETK